MTNFHNPRWTDEEEAFLREHWPTRSGAVIAQAMRRTRNSVMGKAHTLGLADKPKGTRDAGGPMPRFVAPPRIDERAKQLDELLRWIADVLHRDEPIPVNTAIAERFGYASPSVASALLGRLEEGGLIVIERLGRGRRRIEITRHGRKRLGPREPVRTIPLPLQPGTSGDTFRRGLCSEPGCNATRARPYPFCRGHLERRSSA